MNKFDTRHQLLCSDARNLGGTLARGTLGGESPALVDLVVTSPPYPMIAMWDEVFSSMNREIGEHLESGVGGKAFELMHQELDRVWEGLWSLVKPGGWVCLNMGDAVRNLGGAFRMYSNHSRTEAGMAAAGFDVLPPVLWRKASNSPTKFMGSGMLPGGAYVTLEHEFILIFRKPDPDGAARKAALAGDWPERRRQSAIFWEERNVWFSDLWELGGSRQKLKVSGSRERSGAYPLELPFRLVSMFSSVGDTVLDPFSGTGTTSLAALACGRNSIGLDLDTGLVDFSRQRLLRGLGEARIRVEQRLADHKAFLAKRKDAPRYHNIHLDLPVVTRQELGLQLMVPVEALLEEAVTGFSGGTVCARHRDLAQADFPESPVPAGTILENGSADSRILVAFA